MVALDNYRDPYAPSVNKDARIMWPVSNLRVANNATNSVVSVTDHSLHVWSDIKDGIC